MAVAIVSQAHILPAYAHIQQNHTNTQTRDFIQSFQCPSPSFNVTQNIVNQGLTLDKITPASQAQVETLSAPLLTLPQPSSFNHATPELNKNTRALKKFIHCAVSLSKITSPFRNCLQEWPNYIDTPQVIQPLYDNIKKIGSGSRHDVYVATLRHDRQNVKRGTTIALRLKDIHQRTKSAPESLWAYSQVSMLRNYNGYQITEYYPEIYGVYYGPLRPSWRKHPMSKFFTSYEGMHYTEMEHISSSFLDEYKHKNTKIPDNVIFEQCLGEWAAKKITKIAIADNKWQHYGLKDVSYYRAYYIGNTTYLFEPGKTPKRIDLDNFTQMDKQQSMKKYQPNFALPKDAHSRNGRQVLEKISEEGLFRVFSKYFAAYKISTERPIPINQPVRHYYVPDEYL